MKLAPSNASRIFFPARPGINKSHKVLGGIIVSLLLINSSTSPSKAQEPDIEEATPSARLQTAVEQATTALRTDAHEAARLLKAIDPSTLPPAQVNRYFLSATRAALRVGDRAWLTQLAEQQPALQESADNLQILAAMRAMLTADFKGARRILQQIPNPEDMAETPRRRFWQLSQKLEQMDNNPKAERAYAEKMVTFVAAWPSEGCQSCHANPKKYGKQVTTLDLKNIWFGERYSTLLKIMGDAAKVRDEAEKSLQKNPHDEVARIKLSYALRALDDAAGSERELRKIPWSQWPDREIKTPMRFGQFP
jgi:hypothetical protein